MSHTIHYFGRLRRMELLPELQEEFAEFAQVSGWTYEKVDHVFPREEGSGKGGEILRGIRIRLTPTDGPVRFTFDQDGYLAHLYYEPEIAVSPRLGALSLANGVPGVLHHVHASTTLRGQDPYAHFTLVNLLDHLEKRYVPNLEVIDDSGFWTSRDEKALEFRPLATSAP